MILNMKTEATKAKVSWNLLENSKLNYSLNKKNILLIGDSQVGNWIRALNIDFEKNDFNIHSYPMDSICYKFIGLNLNDFFIPNLCKSIINNLQEIENTIKEQLSK